MPRIALRLDGGRVRLLRKGACVVQRVAGIIGQGHVQQRGGIDAHSCGGRNCLGGQTAWQQGREGASGNSVKTEKQVSTDKNTKK